MTIQEYLSNNRLLTDGAMGTYYAKLTDSSKSPSEFANLTEPEKIKNIHKEYLNAGAMLIRTNTFIANTKVLLLNRLELQTMLLSAVTAAKDAIAEYMAEHPSSQTTPFIAGDIGPIPFDAALEEEQYEEYCFIAEELIRLGADALLFETFPNEKLPIQVAKHIKSKYPDIFIMTEITVGMNGYTGSGVSALRMLQYMADSQYIDACGFNCGIGSGHMLKILKGLKLPTHKYLMISPNAGYPEQIMNRMVFMDNASYFAKNMKEIASLGIHIIGACCGSTPEYIRLTKEALNSLPAPLKLAEKISVTETSSKIESGKNAKNSFLKLFEEGKKVIAVELDPPHDANDEKILNAGQKLKDCGVDIITLADSPLGRSRIDSTLMAVKLGRILGIPVMPHICCRDKNMIAMRSMLLGMHVNEIRNLLIVTGDPIPSNIRLNTTAVFDYNSIQLMEYVKEMNQEHFPQDPLVFGGALNYAGTNIDIVIKRMEKKIAAGADYFLTQPIFSDWDIDRVAQIKSKVNTKILCGIMPLISYRNASFIKNEVTGIRLPDEILNRYHESMTREEGEMTGAVIAGEIMEKLSDVADGYYIMLPFNRASLMEKIVIKQQKGNR